MQLRTTKERKQRTKLCSQRACVRLLVVYYFLLSWYRRIRELKRVSQTVAKGVLVSYVYHENENETSSEVRNKRQNLHIFVKKGYIDDARYTFIFTISGRWPSTKEFFYSIGTHEETSILPVSSNVMTVTRTLGSWLYPFLRLATDPRVSLVGSAVSSEIGWHAQTYFIVIKRALVDDLLEMWLRSCSEQDRLRLTFLERGFAIASPSLGRGHILAKGD
ncbi:hypothetical protein BE221DRAFT_208423 [Ostreococcus tauri]|uniref:Uncharacterized protein n=1 Tax=Ostreococcus tauri TaxID=70448 RepID=A0A1Y5I5V7_OSTTA|nr:hypothetical protein BE221DRAFT_208423 [Ostreococcus tauri]